MPVGMDGGAHLESFVLQKIWQTEMSSASCNLKELIADHKALLGFQKEIVGLHILILSQYDHSQIYQLPVWYQVEAALKEDLTHIGGPRTRREQWERERLSNTQTEYKLICVLMW